MNNQIISNATTKQDIINIYVEALYNKLFSISVDIKNIIKDKYIVLNSIINLYKDFLYGVE